MDPRRFYGGIHTIVKDFPDSSADEDLSDDEQLTNRRRNVLPLCIPESEESESDSDDNIPISHLASLSTRTSRAEKPRWRDGFLERAETDLQFTGDISLPLEITALNTRTSYKVPVEKDLKKGRGTTVEKLTTIDNTDISVVTWYDNRVVNLASTYVGSKPSSEVRRFNKKEKAYQNVSCPKAVTVYNRHMGELCGSDPYLPLADFKCAVAEGLSQSNKPSTSGKRGRPSYELENSIEAKKLRGPIAIMPSRDVRLDQIDHMPLWTTRQRCKVPECNGRSALEQRISTVLLHICSGEYSDTVQEILPLWIACE
ncbi:hypothetical protein EVAR_81308_1 [Eumeta japonica]|uniref:PiggyBac transposable element-derived protein domain-containing protein n=1 Tax=Eumeta variegata TaxID=151549 RepID=A0A4C1W2H5_EUMVA|nr:hypothetical protein EVAR_81308_1 [Eumeta japonica]